MNITLSVLVAYLLFFVASVGAATISPEDSCLTSISGQVLNLSKLKILQKELEVKLDNSPWVSKDISEEVKRSNQESFTGLDNILLQRNLTTKSKDWKTCNNPNYKFSAFESSALIMLAEANIKAINMVNEHKEEIILQSKCQNIQSCNLSLYKQFRVYQNEYSWQIIDSIEVAKSQAIKELLISQNNKQSNKVKK